MPCGGSIGALWNHLCSALGRSWPFLKKPSLKLSPITKTLQHNVNPIYQNINKKFCITQENALYIIANLYWNSVQCYQVVYLEKLIFAFSVDHTPQGLAPAPWPPKTSEEKQKRTQHTGTIKPLETVHSYWRKRKPSDTSAGGTHLSGTYRGNVSFEFMKLKGYS